MTYDTDALLRQQQALAEFGGLALQSENLDEILTEACRLVGEALFTDLAKVVEVQEDQKTLRVRAGVGWKPGVVGTVTIQMEDGCAEGYALRSGEPIISPDIDKEKRFQFAPFLIDNGVKAMVNVIILGADSNPPFGILQVDSRTPRDFTENDINFLRSYANLIAAAVSRIFSADQVRASLGRQRMLLDELQHRSRNLLSVVGTLARRTFQGGPQLAEFNSRLAAIGRVQGLLSRDSCWAADLAELVRAELRAHGIDNSEKVTISGPQILLPGHQVQLMALALHELATNATKYGALLVAAGHLHIAWRLEDDGSRLTVEWRETNVPIASGQQPTRFGFGRELIERALPHQLEAQTTFAFTPDGLRCTIALPITQTEDGGA